MNTYSHNPHNQTSREIAQEYSPESSSGAFGFGLADNRSENAMQRGLQQLVQTSPPVLQARTIQQMANERSQGVSFPLSSTVNSPVQRQCAACEEEEALQRYVLPSLNPVQRKGTQAECEGYHAAYKAQPPKKCTQNHTRAEMEANLAATQAHIAGRETYIAEECDDVLPGSIAKGPGVALASHEAELASVKRTASTCEDKIARGKYKSE